MSPFLIQQIANGIMVGSIYALIAMGVAMIYGVMNVPDFALGAKAMLGGYVAFLLTASLHGGYALALIGSIVVLGLLGVAVERWIFRPLAGAPPINGFISSFGLLLVFENFALLAFGSSYRRILSPFDGQSVHILGASLTMQRLLVVVVAIAVMVGLHLFIQYTTLGAAIRAVSQNRRGALLCGIHTERIAGVTMAIGSALAGVAGALIGPIAMVYPSMGETLIVKAFVITILGGMGSIVGAIVGGYILGLIEALGAMYISVDYKDAFAFAVLVLVLTVRPQGLFGKAAR